MQTHVSAGHLSPECCWPYAGGAKDGEPGARDFRDFSRLPPAQENRAPAGGPQLIHNLQY